MSCETACRKDSSIDTSLFTVEVIDDVRHVHNHTPQLGDTPGVKLELIGKIGKLEGKQEKDILYDPVDAARLSNGDILILERGGCSVKRYDKDHEFISSFGQKGQGPGDFLFPFCLRLDPNRNKLYVADSTIFPFTMTDCSLSIRRANPVCMNTKLSEKIDKSAK